MPQAPTCGGAACHTAPLSAGPGDHLCASGRGLLPAAPLSGSGMQERITCGVGRATSAWCQGSHGRACACDILGCSSSMLPPQVLNPGLLQTVASTDALFFPVCFAQLTKTVDTLVAGVCTGDSLS